jgi:hypothetical protein
MATELSKSQILDALRNHNAESVTECAARMKRNRRTISTWLNDPKAINSRIWVNILLAYGVDQAAAELIAADSAKLVPSPVAAEGECRAAAAAKVALTDDGKYAGREWKSRIHSEPRWWNLRRYGADPRFFECGEDECPPLAKGQRRYEIDDSTAICILDARDKKGLTTTAEDLTAGHIANYKLRVPLSGEAFDVEAQTVAQQAYNRLVGRGDLLTDENGHLSLAEHVYDAILLCPQGDPRVKFLIKSAKCRPFALFTTLEERGACVIEDLDLSTEPPPRDPNGPSFEVGVDAGFEDLETEELI